MNGSQIPNMNVVKGLLAVAFGVIFIIFAYSIVLRMFFFLSGILLVYYGLQLLNLQAVNDGLATVKNFVQKFFS